MSPGAIGRRTFAALANPNYRRWYAGQGISLVGTWMQTIAQGWLVYTLTGSGTQLGLVVALQMVPVLILAPYAGVIADRVDKRRLIIGVQAVMAVLALILGVLTVTGAVQLWQVYVLAAGARHRDGLRQPDAPVVRDARSSGPITCATPSRSTRCSSTPRARSARRWRAS